MFPEQLDGRVYLHRLRHPISAEQCRAAGVPYWRRRAELRSATRTNLDNAGGAGGWTFQLIPPVRAWSDRHPAALPSGLGTEAAGVVEDVGPGVDHVKAGDRVAYAAAR